MPTMRSMKALLRHPEAGIVNVREHQTTGTDRKQLLAEDIARKSSLARGGPWRNVDAALPARRVAGDKHSFWAGLTSADLPPRAYDPVGVEFVTGSISAQGLVEIGDRIVKPDHALRALYYTGEHREIPAINYTLLHGVEGNADYSI